METQCNPAYLDFPMLGPRQVLADFDGGDISSDGGALLLRQTEALTGIVRQFAACFTDHRNPDLTEHTVEELIARRVYALAPGYEDLNDHDDLRRDPLLATVVGKGDPTGKTRQRKRDRDKPLAGKSTLNRLERVQPVWLLLSRDRKPLKWREKAQVSGIGPRPVACSRGHYSPPGAERGCSGDLS